MDVLFCFVNLNCLKNLRRYKHARTRHFQFKESLILDFQVGEFVVKEETVTPAVKTEQSYLISNSICPNLSYFIKPISSQHWSCSITGLYKGWVFGPVYLSAWVRVTVQCILESRSTLSSPQTKHGGCADPPVVPTFQRGSWECRSVPPVEQLTGSRRFSSQRSRLIHVTTWEPGTNVQKHKNKSCREDVSRRTRRAKDKENEIVFEH